MKKGLIFLASLGWSLLSLSQSVNLTSSNLPIIVINTQGVEIPDDPKIPADMGIIYNGPGLVNHMSDPFNHYNGKIGIEIRGKSSQSFPMKSYSVELQDATGNDIEQALLGMPKEADWVLYAPYTDKTLMRNFLAYTISREMGNYASRCRYVEVVLNGDYRGVYILEEKIKRGSGRLPITKMGNADNSGDAVTGGYIFKIDKKDPDEQSWISYFKPTENPDRQIEFIYEYPKSENVTNAQKIYLQSYVDSFERALNGANYQDPDLGYRKYADVASFIDFFIVNEVSRNVDGYRLSSYFHKDRDSKGGKLKAGPVWDFDLGFRNADYCSGAAVDGWSFRFNTICRDDYWLVPFWWDRLMTDSSFSSSLRCRWKNLRAGSLNEQRLFFLIDSVNALLGEANVRHFQRWPILGQYIWPNPSPIPTTYAGEITTLKQWLGQRLAWIDQNIPNTGSCFDWPSNKPGTIEVQVYPNPFKNPPSIKVTAKEDQVLQTEVFDLYGRKVFNAQLNVLKGFNFLPVPLDRYPSGLYILRIRNGAGESATFKLMRQ
ncbi:MAG: CotH kinase family protein [Chitinophagaceae bacterium]|nr:CotH kinase family protein [Chitinophagaceae bacterium]